MAELPPEITTIDCHYTAPQKAAAFLLCSGEEAAFIDNNTRFAVPWLLAALDEAGYGPEQVTLLIVTHVHLDHSGATAELAERCPNARVLCHPRAVRHLVSPERLIAGVKQVYGEEEFLRLYGDIQPLPEHRIDAVEDEETGSWAGRNLRFLHTPGHANHHICIYDEKSRSVFTGDCFGCGLTSQYRPGPPFRLCLTAPADFEPNAAATTLERLMGLGAEQAYTTHFGPVQDMQLGASQLNRSIVRMGEIYEKVIAAQLPDDELQAFCEPLVEAVFDDQLRYCGVADLQADKRWLEGDAALNAMGIVMAAQRRRAAAKRAG